MINTCTIVKVRIQFIKAATFLNELKEYSNLIEIIVHTVQHYQRNMLEVFFNQLKIPVPKIINVEIK